MRIRQFRASWRVSNEDETPQFRVGDSFVTVDYTTTVRPAGTREFYFRVKRLGTVTAYRVDVPCDEVNLSQQELAEYLMLKVRHKSKLFSYREP